MAKYTLDRPLYLTAQPGSEDARVVEEGDEAARFVLGGEGSEIPEEDARKYGLLSENKAASKRATAKSDDEGDEDGDAAGAKAERGAEDKAVRGPAATKARAAKSTKSK